MTNKQFAFTLLMMSLVAIIMTLGFVAMTQTTALVAVESKQEIGDNFNITIKLATGETRFCFPTKSQYEDIQIDDLIKASNIPWWLSGGRITCRL